MIITLKRDGKCADCATILKAGSKARWYRNGALYCLDGHNGKVNGDPGEHKAKTDWLSILREANQVASKAYDDYVATNYRQPNYAVVERANPLDDSSPIVKAYPLTDLCGAVWFDFKLKAGRNSELVKWFKANSEKPFYPNEPDRSWTVGEFSLTYDKGCSVWSYPWSLHVPGIGYGNGSFGAMEAKGRAFCNVLDAHGLEIHLQSHLD